MEGCGATGRIRRAAFTRRSHDRFRPAVRDLQARRPAPPRSGTAAALVDRPAPSRPDHLRGQGASSRRPGQARAPAGVHGRAGSQLRGQDRLPRGLRAPPGASPGRRRRPVAQSATGAARGLRHERHEGGAERGAAAGNAGWLVGRRIHGRERMGDTARVGGRGPGPTGHGASVWPARRQSSADVLRSTPWPALRGVGTYDERGAGGRGGTLHHAPDASGIRHTVLRSRCGRRSESRRSTTVANEDALKTRVLHVTAELWPYARTGGLGQAVAGLADYQAASGTETHVVLPLYREAREHAGTIEPFCDPFTVESGGGRVEVRCWRRTAESNFKTLFLEHDPSFDRAGIYGDSSGDFPDNHRRFALFASAAIEIARRIGQGNLILHAHDWHAALVPVFLRRVYRDEPELQRLPAVLTVHNGGFQGVFPREVMSDIALPADLWSPAYMEWYGRLDYLKGGLVFADMVTTVSPTHAFELLTDVGGFGLQHTFRQLDDRLVGIRNGIDVEAWDPKHDTLIPERFSADDLSGKVQCKAMLQEEWELPRR